jgi:hypothetical protein
MSNSINYASTPKIGSVGISTANTNRDGTGTVGTVVSAGASGSKINRIILQALVTTTAGMIRLFLHDGSNFRPLREVPVSAITVSASVSAWHDEIVFADLVLPSGWSIRASTHNAESMVVTALGADL